MLKFVFAFLLKKMVYFKTKELAPIGSKFVPSRVDPFRKGLVVQEIGNNQQTLSPLYKMVEDLLGSEAQTRLTIHLQSGGKIFLYS